MSTLKERTLERDLIIAECLSSGRYSVARDGKVLDHNWRGRSITKPVSTRPSRSGYLLLNMATGGEPRQITVQAHRVVAIAWLGLPDAYMQVNHKNGQKTDNRPDNLEWCDASHNMTHASEHGMLNIQHGSDHVNAKLDNASVIEIKRRLASGQTAYKVFVEYGRDKGVSRAAIRQIASNKAWTHVKVPPDG